jgi:flagellar motor switch protein FliG
VLTTEIHKAAVLLMSLPQEQAATILAQLDPRQIEAVTTEIARCHSITPEEQRSVILEFADVNPDMLTGGKGGLDVAKTLVKEALGKSPDTLAHLRRRVEVLPFRFAQNVDSRTLLAFLFDEHPQTIALVLSHLPHSYSAEIIAGLPAEQQLAVVRRIAAMGPTHPDIIQEVAQALERRMARVIARPLATSGGVPRVAEILNAGGRAAGYSVLENLSQEDPELADEIRNLLFVFEDITRFSDDDIRTILKKADNAQWAMALKGSGEALRQKILVNLSKRAAARLQDAIDKLGPLRRSAVEQARRQIVATIRRLEEAGAITADSAARSEEFVR